MEEEGYVCHTWTKARRHPKVVGVIGGKVMPWPSTNTQLMAFIVTAVVMLRTRAMWGAVLPVPLQALLIGGAPIAAWWGARYWKPEDREPLRAIVGGANYAFRPRQGSRNGRPVRLGADVVTARFFCSGSR